jgi:hypothetical protein
MSTPHEAGSAAAAGHRAGAPAMASSVAASILSGLLAAVLTAGCATTPGGPASASPLPAIAATTGADFCSEAQRIVANSRVPAVNTVFAEREAFIRSKASARPLETRQYAAPEAGPGSPPQMVSCKMKTADHIRTEFGADQAGADETCALLNQRTLDAVLESLTRAERRRARFGGAAGRIVVDADLVVDNGGDWLKPFAIARLEPDGALHLQAKGMNKGWLDPRYANAEVQYRGVRYCHLVAPEYLRRLVLGDATP